MEVVLYIILSLMAFCVCSMVIGLVALFLWCAINVIKDINDINDIIKEIKE